MALYYFIDKNGLRIGPRPADELLGLGLTYNSPVWTEGLPDWVPASDVSELREIFEGKSHSTPPPPPIDIHGATQPDSQTYRPGNGFTPPSGQSAYRQNNMPYPSMPPQKKPSSYLALAILCTLFCCLPFGIVSIFYSAKVDSLWLAGRQTEAREASKKAWMWAMISVACTAVVSVVYFALFLLGIVFS